ncbi:uncharacterized protein VTP21DRAFT_314 [Calcarisporiella thermophila]|uniref:uncharacterized protein n=1 Tax=Calcarisporiella thermophila TaxID=911321 RepID=UPI003742C315
MVFKSTILSCLLISLASTVFAAPSGEKLNVPEAKFGPSDDTRIYNGEKVNSGEMPFVLRLSLKKNGSYYRCTGSLIAKDAVLTAAHCLDGKEGATVHYGNNQSVNSKRLVMHPRYRQTGYNDVGLIFLERGIDVKPVVIDTNIPKEFDDMTAAGYGQTEKGGSSNQLLKIDIEVSDYKTCRDNNGHFTGFDGPELCTNPGTKKTTCNGDSGGPYLTGGTGNYKLLGVNSRKIGPNHTGKDYENCGEERSITFFGRAGHHIKWIKEEGANI